MTHPSRRLDDAVHQRTRLGILAVLAEAGRVEFTRLRNALDLTDGNLSRNVTKLQEAGYVQIEKSSEGRGTRTWLAITGTGRDALTDEITALRDLITRVEAPSTSDAPARSRARSTRRIAPNPSA